jgi:hypothetical protein
MHSGCIFGLAGITLYKIIHVKQRTKALVRLYHIVARFSLHSNLKHSFCSYCTSKQNLKLESSLYV